MAFDNLEPQGPWRAPEVAAYAERALALSRAALDRVVANFDIAYGPEPRQQLFDLRGEGEAVDLLRGSLSADQQSALGRLSSALDGFVGR